jgi:hypothetical protein
VKGKGQTLAAWDFLESKLEARGETFFEKRSPAKNRN